MLQLEGDLSQQLIELILAGTPQELVNDFEAPIFKMHPELAEIKQKLYNLGAVYAAMSGEKKNMCVLKIGDMVSIEQCE